MDQRTKNLKGSPSRDDFKLWHKTLSRNLYACDFDLVLVNGSGIVAVLDYKMPNDRITWSEAIAYNNLLRLDVSVYLVIGRKPFENLKILRYRGCDTNTRPLKPDMQTVTSTTAHAEYDAWEQKLRRAINSGYYDK